MTSEKAIHNRLYWNMFIGGLLFLNIVLLVMLSEEFKTGGPMCLADPLVYGVQKLEEVNTPPVTCECRQSELNSQYLVVTSNGTSIHRPEIVREPGDVPLLNISKIFQTGYGE